jgi:hypothetical protein
MEYEADFLLSLFLGPEDGSGGFLSNICCLSMDYMVLYPRRQNATLSA